MNVESILSSAPRTPSAAVDDARLDDPSDFDQMVGEAQDEASDIEPARSRGDADDKRSTDDHKGADETRADGSADKRKPADNAKASDDGSVSPTQSQKAVPSVDGEPKASHQPTDADAEIPGPTPRAAVMLAKPEGDPAAVPVAGGAPASPNPATTPTAAVALVLQIAPSAQTTGLAAATATSAQAQTPALDPTAASPAAPDAAPPAPESTAASATPVAAAKAAASAQPTAPAQLAAAAPEAPAPSPREGRETTKSSKSDPKASAAGSGAADTTGTAKPAAAPATDLAAAARTTAAPANDAAAKPDVAAAKTAAPAGGVAADVAEGVDLRRADSHAASHAPERAQTPRPQIIDLAALATRFAARAKAGATSFSIRLDPPELGRVDVKLEVAADGAAHARLTAERPEALAELSRHARALERALAEAGVELARDGLSFELAGRDGEAGQNAFADGFRQEQAAFEKGARAPVAVDAAPEAPALAPDALVEVDSAYGFAVLKRGRLDVRI